MKKPYEKPAVIYSGRIEGRTSTCISGDDSCRTNGGPINS